MVLAGPIFIIICNFIYYLYINIYYNFGVNLWNPFCCCTSNLVKFIRWNSVNTLKIAYNYDTNWLIWIIFKIESFILTFFVFWKFDKFVSEVIIRKIWVIIFDVEWGQWVMFDVYLSNTDSLWRAKQNSTFAVIFNVSIRSYGSISWDTSLQQ